MCGKSHSCQHSSVFSYIIKFKNKLHTKINKKYVISGFNFTLLNISVHLHKL